MGVERLNTVAPHFGHHPDRVFAVVERSGSHVKVCAVSHPVRPTQPPPIVPAGQTRWQVMQDLAWAGAKSYGARYVENPHPDDEPTTNGALRRDLPGRHRAAAYDPMVDVALIDEPTSGRHAAVAA